MKNMDKIEHIYTWEEPWFYKNRWVTVGTCVCGAQAKKSAVEKYGEYGNYSHRKNSDQTFVKMCFKTPTSYCTRTLLPGEGRLGRRRKPKSRLDIRISTYRGAHVWIKKPWKQGAGGYLYQESKCKFCPAKKIHKKHQRGTVDMIYKVFHSGKWFLYAAPSGKRLINTEKYSNIPPCPGPPDRAV